ncbi:MAG: hypothetical protein K8E24_005080 [Methanobacterium paludis]|nr:hypothetical protein [Methanobacterium paludis]
MEEKQDKLLIKDLDEEINVDNLKVHEIKSKWVFIILVIFTFVIAFLSYMEKSVLLFDIATIMVVPIISLILFLGIEHNFKLCKLIMGNFSLNDSEKVAKYIYKNALKSQKRKKKIKEFETRIHELKKSKIEVHEIESLEKTLKKLKSSETEITQLQEERIRKNYLIVAISLIVSFFAVINSFKISISFLIVPGLSLISIGAALGVLTFNYAKIAERNNTNNLIFSSAKRFYLSTIFAIFLLVLILIECNLFPVMKHPIIFTPYDFIVTYLEFCLSNSILLLSFYLSATTLNYLYEGFVLVLKETITFG